MMAPVAGALMLTHLIQNGYEAKDTKSKHTNHAKGYSPCFAIVKAFDKHHKTNNGNKHCGSKKRELHSYLIFVLSL
jgi:hypothetical protein